MWPNNGSTLNNYTDTYYTLGTNQSKAPRQEQYILFFQRQTRSFCVFLWHLDCGSQNEFCCQQELSQTSLVVKKKGIMLWSLMSVNRSVLMRSLGTDWQQRENISSEKGFQAFSYYRSLQMYTWGIFVSQKFKEQKISFWLRKRLLSFLISRLLGSCDQSHLSSKSAPGVCTLAVRSTRLSYQG